MRLNKKWWLLPILFVLLLSGLILAAERDRIRPVYLSAVLMTYTRIRRFVSTYSLLS